MNKIAFLSLKHKILNKLQKYLPFIDSDKMMYRFLEKEFDDVNKLYTGGGITQNQQDSNQTKYGSSGGKD